MSTKKIQILGSLGSNVEVDPTLTEEGKAADAKAVGEAIRTIELTPGPKGEDGAPGKDAPQESVLYIPQELTEDQKAQALANLGLDELPTGGEMERVVDFTTEETVVSFSIPIDDDIKAKIKEASEVRISVMVPTNAEDTTTSTKGNITIKLHLTTSTWEPTIIGRENVIPAPTSASQYQAMFAVIDNPKMGIYATCARGFVNSDTSLGSVFSAAVENNIYKYVAAADAIKINGSINMAAGTRVIVEVRK